MNIVLCYQSSPQSFYLTMIFLVSQICRQIVYYVLMDSKLIHLINLIHAQIMGFDLLNIVH